ncbi:MAG: glycosyltransferase family A protein [Defluviicoccus sp.]|nr:glycosyltransferase family A protein [Defluviicoccus sp.]
MTTAPAVSVLTPTYNRAHVLHRAYDSLQRQKTRDFEWVVVDDGSTDRTPGLLARWQAEADFPIAWYRYDNNRGRNAAVNSGSEFVSGDYTLILDSDDALLDDALESIAYWRERTRIDASPDVYQLVFPHVDETGTLLGRFPNRSAIPGEAVRKSFREAHYGMEIAGETVGVTKTPVFRERRFVELTNSEHCPEGVTHNRMSQQYQSIFVDRPIGRCFRHDGEARLTDRWPDAVKWPRGTYLRALAGLNDDIGFFRDKPARFLNYARKIARLGLHIGRSPGRQFRDLRHAPARLLWAMAFPAGIADYARDRLRGRGASIADPDISAWGPAVAPESPVFNPPPRRLG